MPTIFFDTFGGSHPPIKLGSSKGEFSALEIDAIRQAVAYISELLEIALAAADRCFSGDDHLYYMLHWLGKNDRKTRSHVANAVRALYAAFNDPERLITFVDIRGKLRRNIRNIWGTVIDNPAAMPDNFFIERELIREYIIPKSMFGAVFQALGNTNSTCLGHLGAGMRIYIGYGHKTPFDFAQTILHELSHKILATGDHPRRNGKLYSLLLAERNPEKSLVDADCWAWFICSLKHEGPYPYIPDDYDSEFSDSCSEEFPLSTDDEIDD